MMRGAFAISLLLLSMPAAQAGSLCGEYDIRGDYDLGSACRIDEMQRQQEAERRAYEDSVNRSIEQRTRQTDDMMRQIMLDDRLRDIENRNR